MLKKIFMLNGTSRSALSGLRPATFKLQGALTTEPFTLQELWKQGESIALCAETSLYVKLC